MRISFAQFREKRGMSQPTVTRSSSSGRDTPADLARRLAATFACPSFSALFLLNQKKQRGAETTDDMARYLRLTPPSPSIQWYVEPTCLAAPETVFHFQTKSYLNYRLDWRRFRRARMCRDRQDTLIRIHSVAILAAGETRLNSKCRACTCVSTG
ncbi:hypothetical protein CCM_00569 [Cordyceps militaris CM01]|uniref:Uncharacterized protein n=1 Tax=Cordyceps militaris (strain CM01) TaxID=983644 RepID=G3J4U8_CORMM|nr:uncharacterized protein CCM_00569 [Cordyceps militaris CM01]EGX95915.1 hypothetical protein CCM_00569 [Cordyceps militaris CM01]